MMDLNSETTGQYMHLDESTSTHTTEPAHIANILEEHNYQNINKNTEITGEDEYSLSSISTFYDYITPCVDTANVTIGDKGDNSYVTFNENTTSGNEIGTDVYTVARVCAQEHTGGTNFCKRKSCKILLITLISVVVIAGAASLGVVLTLKHQDIDGCISSPCKSGATCNDNENGFTCTCANGWTGIHCEKAVEYGTSFITGFMKDNNDNLGTPTLIIVCTEGKANITVSIPALSIINERHEITDGALKLTYSNASSSYTSGMISKKGVHITSDRQVVLFAGNLRERGSADGSLVPKEISLGTNYIISGYPDVDITFDQFLIVGIIDGTIITITIKSLTEKITLNRMETYFYSQKDLTGSMISSDFPVYVVSGHACANIPNASVKYCDYIDELMPPISSLGNLHVVTYMKPRPDFTISVASPYNNTTVKIYNAAGIVLETITSMKRSDAIFRTYSGSQTLFIAATQPVLVTQYGHGSNYTGGDPSMMTIPDVNHFGHKYDFVALKNFDSSVTLVINSSYSINGLLLDGVAFAPTETITATIRGTGDYIILYVDIDPGYHRLEHTAGTTVSFGAWLYGRQVDAEYAWSLGHT